MKRLFSLFVAMFMVFGMANAQTIENHGVFSNMYVGLNGGAIHNPVSNYDKFQFNALDWNGALEIGKDITPITGISVEGIYNNKVATAKKTELNRMDVFANAKFNLMNLFGGYNGMPRVFEIRTLTGIGWNHYLENYSNPNDIALQAGLEFDFNLGKNRNWYVTFTPAVQFNEINDGYKGVAPAFKNGDLKANLGIAYRFGSNDGSHNFVICDKTYTDEQYADLYAKYDEAMNRPVEVDTVVVEKVVETVIEKTITDDFSNTIIVFAKNSFTLSNAEEHRLEVVMKELDKNGEYLIIGSADTTTGNNDINNRLANERATTVKNIMNKNGFKNVETTVNLDVLNDQTVTRCAIIRMK